MSCERPPFPIRTSLLVVSGAGPQIPVRPVPTRKSVLAETIEVESDQVDDNKHGLHAGLVRWMRHEACEANVVGVASEIVERCSVLKGGKTLAPRHLLRHDE